MRLSRRTRLTIEGWCCLVVLAFLLGGALMRNMNLLLALFGMLCAPVLLNWRLVRRTLGRLDVRRKLPQTASAGDLLVVEIEATNRRRRRGSWAVVVSDAVAREGAGPEEKPLKARAMFSYVPARGESKESYRGRLMRRGRWRFGPMRVTTSFPFGLIRSTVTIDQQQTLLVYPRLGQLTRRWHRLHQSADVGASHVQRKQSMVEGDFFGLREWRPGDSRKWVHWRTTARRQTPIVRQFEQQRHQDLGLVLDLWQPAKPIAADLDNVELAVSFAASVVSDMCRQGGRSLWLAAAAREPSFNQGPASAALGLEAMEALAVAEASDADGLPDALERVLDCARAGANVIVVSTRGVDWSDTERFERIWSHPRHRAWLGKIQWVDASREDFAEFFIPS